MAPKDLKKDIREEKVLQCVILAECLQDYGKAISQEIPKILTPLVNTPLLDYTLDWLERSGIDEVIVYCSAQSHVDMVREHCKGFMSRRSENGMTVIVITSENCHSTGDAMRDLYSKSLLKDDFFLMYGDIIANLDLKALMAIHKQRRTSDKKLIMTLVYLNKICNNEIKDSESYATLITNAATGKIFSHSRSGSSKSKMPVSVEWLKSSNLLRIFPAVQDPGIAICSEVVPSLFSDNFDYGTHDSLIKGVIEQEELLGYNIGCEVLESGYATRASCLPMYEKVSGEVIRRQAYPLVPEVSLTSHRIRYHYNDFTNNYWEASAKFHKGSGGRDVVVGAGSEVSSSAKLGKSVIGDHCIIGDNANINSSFIMNNVHIKKNCVLNQCYIGNNVKLEENVTLLPGCVVGAGAVLGPNITIPASTHLSANPIVDEFDNNSVNKDPDPKLVGSQGRAFVIECEDDEDLEIQKITWGKVYENPPTEDEESSDEGESDGDIPDEIHMRDEDEQREYEFQRETKDHLSNALVEGTLPENVVLEINASRYAYNMSMEEVLRIVTQGIIRAGEKQNPDSYDSEGLWALTKNSLTKLIDVLRKYVRKHGDQLMVLEAIEYLVSDHKPYLPLAQKILYELNQEHELLDDELLIYWHRKVSPKASMGSALRKTIEKFIDWLDESDDEEEDDED